MVRFTPCPPYRPPHRRSPRSSWPDWPSARNRPSGCANSRPPRSTTSSHRDSPSYSCPLATAADRPPFRPSSIPSADGARMRLERVDDRLLRTAQLDAGAVRRARAGGGVRDPAVPRARTPGADGPGRPDARRRPADRPVVMGHRRDVRQLDHRRCVVWSRGRSSRHLPALALLPAGDIQIEDVWHTDGMRATVPTTSLPQAIPCRGRRVARPGWPQRTSCTSRGP
jgi:hypothetical protein